MDLKMNEAFILDAPHIDQIGESMEEYLARTDCDQRIAGVCKSGWNII